MCGATLKSSDRVLVCGIRYEILSGGGGDGVSILLT